LVAFLALAAPFFRLAFLVPLAALGVPVAAYGATGAVCHSGRAGREAASSTQITFLGQHGSHFQHRQNCPSNQKCRAAHVR